MKSFGSIFRYILNINTIWGLMILSSFFAFTWQHFAPQQTFIPASLISSGENELVVNFTNPQDEVLEFPFFLTMETDRLLVNEEALAAEEGEVFIVGTQAADDGYTVTWDVNNGHGAYELFINGELVERSEVRTLATMSDAAVDYAEIAFNIALGLVAIMVLFLGLMKVGQDAGIVDIVARFFHPIINFLYPEIPKNHPAAGAILMNATTTILGLGNAATPFGLKAMQELQSLNENKKVASNSMVMLLGYNTAGFAILPTTLIAVRQAAGTTDPFAIIATCMFAGGVATITAIIAVKVYGLIPVFSYEAAVAEQEEEDRRARARGEDPDAELKEKLGQDKDKNDENKEDKE